MSLAILSSTKPSPYDVGATELRNARKAMKQLKDLKVGKETYKRAEDAKSSWNWNWITGDDACKDKIEKQTKLEKEISKNLYGIAAANARNRDAVSSEVLKEARSIEDQLDERRIMDYDHASRADADSYTQDAYNAVSDQLQLDHALNGAKKDVISLDETKSFIDEFRKEERKLKDATEIFSDPASSKSEVEQARKDMAASSKELGKKWNLMARQVGPLLDPAPGIADAKYWALPDGDALKKPYEAQDKDLRDLQIDFYVGPKENVETV
jgi:hypothetical protein